MKADAKLAAAERVLNSRREANSHPVALDETGFQAMIVAWFQAREKQKFPVG